MHKQVHISKGKYALSKRKKRFILFSCLLFTAALSLLDKIFFTHKWQSWSENTVQKGNVDFKKYHSQIFTIINIIDGDTLDIDYPDGPKRYTRIRLLGIDTPEMNTKSGEMYYANEAKDFVIESAFGKKVTIYLDEINNTRDKYDRLLAYVLLPDGKYLNEILLNDGYAYAYTKYRHSFYNKYNQLESLARNNKKGLWLNVKPGQFPQWLQDQDKNSQTQ